MTAGPVRCRAFGCGRELKTAVSRARGYGPDCWEALHPAPPARHHLSTAPVTVGRSAAGAPQTGPDLLDQLDDEGGRS